MVSNRKEGGLSFESQSSDRQMQTVGDDVCVLSCDVDVCLWCFTELSRIGFLDICKDGKPLLS